MSGNTATNNSNANESDPLCEKAYQVVTLPYSQVARSVFILVNTVIVILVVKLSKVYRKNTLAIHGNLKIFYVNIVLLYGFNAFDFIMVEVRNVVVSIFYAQNACSLLTPFWYVLLTRISSYWITVSLSLLHFAGMLERLRATLRVARYENEGRKFGIVILLIIYLIATGFLCFFLSVVISDLEPFDLNAKLVANTLVTKNSNQVFVVLSYVLLAIALLVAGGDWILYRANKVLRARTAKGFEVGNWYHLGTRYQLNENLNAIAIILPLDISYAVITVCMHIANIALRLFLSDMSLAAFLGTYNWINIVMSLYHITALISFRRFIRQQQNAEKRSATLDNRVAPIDQSGNLYFKQLESQWN